VALYPIRRPSAGAVAGGIEPTPLRPSAAATVHPHMNDTNRQRVIAQLLAALQTSLPVRPGADGGSDNGAHDGNSSDQLSADLASIPG
jgi:hypothetical protein